MQEVSVTISGVALAVGAIIVLAIIAMLLVDDDLYGGNQALRVGIAIAAVVGIVCIFVGKALA